MASPLVLAPYMTPTIVTRLLKGVNAAVHARPLADIRVLDLSLLFPGPYCAQMMADLGADVISVEPLAGDFTRRMPSEGHSVVNRNKRGVALDLKDPMARAACLRMASGVDVVIEGFRPGVIKRLGLDYERVKEVNEDVIYCSISGFGQTGPLSSHPGHDLTYLCASGALSFSGHWAEPPRRQGVPLGDVGASTYAALAILAALHDRAKTGKGCYLDVAITDTAMAFATLRGGPSMNLDPRERLHLYPLNDLFTGSDGRPFSVAAIEEHFWQALRPVLARYQPEVLDRAFDGETGRRANGDRLHQLLVEAFAQQPAEKWVEELSDKVPVHEILTLTEAADSSQTNARGLVTRVQDQRHLRFPVLRDGEPMGDVLSVAPQLGEHTRQVLEECGVDADHVDMLVAALAAGRDRPRQPMNEEKS